MTDFYPLMAKAVAALEQNTKESRQAIYARARAALQRHLDGLAPRPSDTDVDRTLADLGDALRRVEAENESAPAPASANPDRADVVGACDICLNNYPAANGFALTTRQVVTSEAYWVELFERQKNVLNTLDPEGRMVASWVAQAAGISTPWRVCDACIGLFDVDRGAASRDSRDGSVPAGAGPMPPEEACMPAGYAWSRTFRRWPVSIRVGSARTDPSEGRRCDFCARVVTDPSTPMGLVSENAIEAFQRRAGVSALFEPTLMQGAKRWVACPKCLERHAAGRGASASG